MRTRRPGAMLLAVACALLVGACGDDSDEEPSAPRPPETIEAVPELPERWKVHVNRPAGFSFGLPPGWKAADRNTSTLVRSFDRLVAVQIAADRTDEALETPLEEFAVRALVALPGFESDLEPGEPRQFKHRYEGIAVGATGTAVESGVPQRLQLIVLRRDQLVTFTIVIAAGRGPGAATSAAVAEAMVRTLRSRPVVVGASPAGV